MIRNTHTGTSLEFLRYHWYTGNCFLIQKVVSALVKSQGTEFTETRAATMNTILRTQGTVFLQIQEKAFFLAS